MTLVHLAFICVLYSQVLSPELVHHSLRCNAASFLISTVTVDVTANEVKMGRFELIGD